MQFSTIKLIFFVSIDDVEDAITVSFELANYGATEGQQTVEVCVITSATPAASQTVTAQISTQDGTAVGKS